jgi:hypothetical protein
MITKADKGNFILILSIQEYDKKINNFITENHFLTVNTDPTSTFQIPSRKIINTSKTLIPQKADC